MCSLCVLSVCCVPAQARAKRKQKEVDEGRAQEAPPDKKPSVNPGSNSATNLDSNMNIQTNPSINSSNPKPPNKTGPGVDLQDMLVTVNNKLWRVPGGMLDVKTTFGEGVTLYTELGEPVPMNARGIVKSPVQHKATYTTKPTPRGYGFCLLSRPTNNYGLAWNIDSMYGNHPSFFSPFASSKLSNNELVDILC